MSLSTGGQFLFVRSPLVQTLRSRSRTPNIRKPAIPHWHRAVALKLTKPIYKDPLEGVHPAETCRKKENALKKLQKQINPFEQILAREFLEKIEDAKMVAIFHQFPMTMAELFAARLQLNKINLLYLKHNNNMVRLAFSGTKYEALLKLYESTTVTFAGDQIAVAKLLKMQKKIAGLVLLGGVVENRFMSVEDLKRYAALPSLQTLQGQLVGILSSPAQRVSHNLVNHQMELSSSLARYVMDKISPESTDPDSPSSQE